MKKCQSVNKKEGTFLLKWYLSDIIHHQKSFLTEVVNDAE